MSKRREDEEYEVGFPDSNNYNVSFRNGSEYQRYVDSVQLRHEMIKMKLIVAIVLIVVALAVPLFIWGVGRFDSHQANLAMMNSPDPIVTINCSASEYIGEDYLIVVQELEAMGFTNIQIIPKYDLITGWIKHPGATISVSIEGNRNFEAGDTVPQNATVIIVYHALSK